MKKKTPRSAFISEFWRVSVTVEQRTVSASAEAWMRFTRIVLFTRASRNDTTNAVVYNRAFSVCRMKTNRTHSPRYT